MAQQFGTTSFIPKKPQVSAARKRTGVIINIFFLGSLIIFLGAVTASAGVFIYKGFVSDSIAQKQTDLEKAREAFEPALIGELALLDTRLDAAREILDAHIALSSFFDLLERSTLRSVQFDTFGYTITQDGRIGITMSGKGRSFSSVALQSKIFGEEPFIQSSLFSNLDLDDFGNIVFDFTASLDSALVSYRAGIEGLTQQ